MKRVLHILPALPPLTNGLGDFGYLLAGNLGKKGFDNSFFVIRNDPSHQNNTSVFDFNKYDFYKKIKEFKPSIVILHYAGYAYHNKGLPFYLAKGLKKIKTQTGCRILVFFHELYSSSKSPLRLSFYTNFLQKKIIQDLYEVADKTFTNCTIYHNLLHRLLLKEPGKNTCTGIYSNIPDDLYDERIEKKKELVVFGTLERRNAVYNSPSFAEFIERNAIKIIDDIGPGRASFNHPHTKLNIKGCLQPNEAATCLNQARFGSIHYPPGLLAKSGIFSAYSAFGVITINVFEKEEPLYDGLVIGKNYFNIKSEFNNNAAVYEDAKQEIRNWYKKRNQHAIANTIIKQL